MKRNRKTIARLMRKHQIRSKIQRKFRVSTTDSKHDHPIAPNLLDRNFEVKTLDTVWLCDITYIPTDEGWLYLAGVMDLCSRRIVGWSMASHMRVELVMDALKMARTRREPRQEMMVHSDRGVQYACAEFRSLLEQIGAVASMSRRGNCHDNAPKESFWATLKNELVHHEEFATHQQARAAIFNYIETFYNRKRLHSSLGYVSPESFEASMTGV